MDEKKKAAIADVLHARMNRQLLYYLDICTRCSLCKDACHQYVTTKEIRYLPAYRAEIIRRIYRKYSTHTGKISSQILELNSSEVSSLSSKTPFTIILTRTDNPEQLLLINGSLAFSPSEISIPTPIQNFSANVTGVSYRFIQTQYGYNILLNNYELIHSKVPPTKVIGDEKTVSVTIQTGDVENLMFPIENRSFIPIEEKTVNPDLEEIISLWIDKTIHTIIQRINVILLGGLLLTICTGLVLNKRRTNRWIPRRKL